MPIDTSMYPTRTAKPTNPLELVGQYTNVNNSLVQNKLLNQQLQQAEMQTQVAQGRQRVGELIAKNTKEDGQVNWLGVQSDASRDSIASHPEVYSSVQDLVNNQLNAVEGGLGKDKQPIRVSQQQRNTMLGGGQKPAAAAPQQQMPTGDPAEEAAPQAQQAPPSIDVGLPPGFEDKQKASRERINQVQNEASNIAQSNAILNKIQDLSKTAPTGQLVGKVYQFLAEKGVTAKDIIDPAIQLQEIKKYMHQAAIVNGVPDSDARLIAIEVANPNSEQLPETIQNLVPFLMATNEGKLMKQKYYNKTLKGSMDADLELKAKQFWDDHYDPRLIELYNLPGEKRANYIKTHPDVKKLLPKYQELKKAGIFSKEGQ